MAMYKMGMSMGGDFDKKESFGNPVKKLRKLITKLDNVLTMDAGEIAGTVKDLYSKKDYFKNLSLDEQAKLSFQLAKIFNDTTQWNQEKKLDDTSGRFDEGNGSNKRNSYKVSSEINTKDRKESMLSKGKKSEFKMFKENINNRNLGSSREEFVVGKESMEMQVNLKDKISEMITLLNELRNNKIRNLLNSAKGLSAIYMSNGEPVKVSISADGSSLSIQKSFSLEKNAPIKSLIQGEEVTKTVKRRYPKITVNFKNGEMILKIGGEKTLLGPKEIQTIEKSIEKAKEANVNKLEGLTLEENKDIQDPTQDWPNDIA